MAYDARQTGGTPVFNFSVDDASVINLFQCFPGNMHFAWSALASF